MKDIGYYAGFLIEKDREAIASASVWQLSNLMMEISSYLAFLSYGESIDLAIDIGWVDQSDLNKVAIIRGLCDRIELRLMEETKYE